MGAGLKGAVDDSGDEVDPVLRKVVPAVPDSTPTNVRFVTQYKRRVHNFLAETQGMQGYPPQSPLAMLGFSGIDDATIDDKKVLGGGVHAVVAGASAGVVGFSSGAGVYAEGSLFGRAVGVGVYTNATTTAACESSQR